MLPNREQLIRDTRYFCYMLLGDILLKLIEAMRYLPMIYDDLRILEHIHQQRYFTAAGILLLSYGIWLLAGAIGRWIQKEE